MQEKKERNAAKDFVSGLLLVLFGIFVVFDAMSMKIYNTFLDAPGFFPAIVGGVIVILGAILAYIGYRLGGLTELKEVLNGAFLKQFITSDGTVRVLILIAMMVVYIWVLLGRMHFIIATSIYLIANFLYLKAMKQWWISIIIAVAMSAIVYYAFKLGFGISMP
ncbi:MAG: tripartite tricarboxylate transporter TctB family protein [Lachnospiraceae bacterium]|nr:tripartite tricarboxylate transporter TctB family protein [Lachnospiraceae bacterium]